MAYATIAIMNWNVTGSIGRRLPQVEAPFQACISIAKRATIRRHEFHCGLLARLGLRLRRLIDSTSRHANYARSDICTKRRLRCQLHREARIRTQSEESAPCVGKDRLKWIAQPMTEKIALRN